MMNDRWSMIVVFLRQPFCAVVRRSDANRYSEIWDFWLLACWRRWLLELIGDDVEGDDYAFQILLNMRAYGAVWLAKSFVYFFLCSVTLMKCFRVRSMNTGSAGLPPISWMGKKTCVRCQKVIQWVGWIWIQPMEKSVGWIGILVAGLQKNQEF